MTVNDLIARIGELQVDNLISTGGHILAIVALLAFVMVVIAWAAHDR